MHKIAFIGLGIMGKAMARNLMRAGFELHIWARHKEKVEDIIAEGACFHPDIARAVASCEAVITIVGFPADVEEVYLAPGNIMDSAAPGAYLIDMTTSSPALAVKLHQLGSAKGYKVLDAPVTGGDTGARAGTLSILVGGDKADCEACRPLFAAMGSKITHQGGPGAGQHAKLANQIVIAGTLSGVCEGLAYAKAQGLDTEAWLDSVADGAAGSAQMKNFGPKILAGDLRPGFFMKHFIKDMDLARQEAQAAGLKLDVLEKVLAAYKELAAQGLGEAGTQALIKHYEK